MKCANCFCLHNKNNACNLPNLRVDVRGMCKDMIVLDQKFNDAIYTYEFANGERK